MIQRIEVNNRRLNHAYTLVTETGHRVLVPFTCDLCIKAAKYQADNSLLCLDHYLDKVWGKSSDRVSTNQERGEAKPDYHSQGAETKR